MPFHSIPAVFAALFFRLNLPLCLLLVWVNNPLTLIPILYFSFFVGSMLLHQHDSMQNAPSFQDLQQIIANIFTHRDFPAHAAHLTAYIEPILLGMLITGFTLGCIGYLGMNWFWHYRVMSAWRKRQQNR
jgi:uncharacterized protein (DUF2062 family)